MAEGSTGFGGFGWKLVLALAVSCLMWAVGGWSVWAVLHGGWPRIAHLPLLIGGLLAAAGIVVWLISRRGDRHAAFPGLEPADTAAGGRGAPVGPVLDIAAKPQARPKAEGVPQAVLQPTGAEQP